MMSGIVFQETLEEIYSLTTTSSPILDSRFIFPALSVVSVVALLLQAAFALSAAKSPKPPLDPFSPGLVHRNGGWLALGWGITRFLGLLALVGLQVVTVLDGEKGGKVVQLAELVSFSYLSAISLVSIVSPPSPSSTLSRSLRPTLVLLLLSSFFVYLWRDAGPLYSYTKTSLDPWTQLSTIKFSLLAAVSILPPLCTPRIFVPVSLASPTVPNAEETASPLSILMFAFVDATVFKAWRKPTSLDLDDLPTILSRDEAEYLRRTHMKWLDPQSPTAKRSLLLAFLRIWWKESIIGVVCSIGFTTFQFGDIVGMNQLLLYVQDPSNASIRPWVWVFLIGTSPLISSSFISQFWYQGFRFSRQMESLMLQLLFEHSLRIRVNEAPAASSELKDGETLKAKASLVGKINSLMSSDIAQAAQSRMGLLLYIDVFLDFALGGYGLYRLLGWSAFVAMFLAFMVLPVTAQIIKLQSKLQKQFKSLTDVRVQKVSEALLGLRTTKMLGLESKVKADLNESRLNELQVNKRSQFVSLAGNVITSVLPNLVVIVTLAVFLKLQGGILDAATIFTAIGLLHRFSNAITGFFYVQEFWIQPKTALGRLEAFLNDTPLIDREVSGELTPVEEEWIGFKNAAFTWYKDLPEDSELHNFRLDIEDLRFEKGKITVLTGPTGGGKTSLLMALLGEMHYENKPDSICSLPRSEGIAYVHQQSFLRNLSVRDNVTFGAPFDRERYDETLLACGLEQDLALFKAGDLTEVGEKGITLSGGQKARLTLARAIYSPAKTVLIDDCFSSLDVQTSKWVVEKCFASDLVKGRTIILITHHLSLVRPVTDFLVQIEGGRIVANGPVDKVLAAEPSLLAEDELEVKKEIEIEAIGHEATDEKTPEAPEADGRLAVEEEKAAGKVSFSVMAILIKSFGSWPFWVTYIALGVVRDLGGTLENWWFAQWSRQAQIHEDPREVNVPYYLGIYSAIAMATIGISAISRTLWTFARFRSGKAIHERLLDSVIACTLRFLDVTPQGRLLSRFTKDVRACDTSLPSATQQVLTYPSTLITQLFTIVVLVPIFSISSFVIAGLAGFVAHLYLTAQRAVKREQSNRQSPVFSHFAEAMAGVVSIRAFGAENLFRVEGITRVNSYIRAFNAFSSLNRWSGVRFDTLNATFSLGLTSYLIWGPEHRDASSIGLVLSVSLGFTQSIMWVLRSFNDWEIDLVSVERIQNYVDIEHEPEATPSGEPPAYWPASGNLVVEGLSARYTKDGPKVLDNVSFTLKTGEKCAVVGRTGSGKSTLALSLLRLIPTEGAVLIDGLESSKLNLEALRSNVTIIPQDPTLFSGDIRKNIDPFGSSDDATLNDILRSVGLLKAPVDLVVESSPGTSISDSSTADTKVKGALSLDTKVSAGGENLSQGTRQLVSYARGLVRRSKLYIFDEATASVDYETDALIQRTLRSEMQDVSLLTIAHRLLSIIDYDKVLVLSAGKVVEFGTPAELLKIPKGHFRSLVDVSSDREKLLEIVKEGSKA